MLGMIPKKYGYKKIFLLLAPTTLVDVKGQSKKDTNTVTRAIVFNTEEGILSNTNLMLKGKDKFLRLTCARFYNLILAYLHENREKTETVENFYKFGYHPGLPASIPEPTNIPDQTGKEHEVSSEGVEGDESRTIGHAHHDSEPDGNSQS